MKKCRRIEFPLMSLEKQVIHEVLESYLEIYPDHVICRMAYYSDLDDEDTPTGRREDALIDYTFIGKRNHMTGLELSYSQKDLEEHCCWLLEGSFVGMRADLRLCLKSEKLSRQILAVLQAYMLGQDDLVFVEEKRPIN